MNHQKVLLLKDNLIKLFSKFKFELHDRLKMSSTIVCNRKNINIRLLNNKLYSMKIRLQKQNLQYIKPYWLTIIINCNVNPGVKLFGLSTLVLV